jgi:3-oxoadipate enol-lactonase
MSGDIWSEQALYFHGSHRVICIDPPGHGRSESLTGRFSLEQCATCLREILDELGIEDCVLLGNSWGGMMGAVFAATHPSRLRGAILINSTASPATLLDRVEMAFSSVALRFQKRPMSFVISRTVGKFAGRTSLRTRPEAIRRIKDGIARQDARSVSWAIMSVVAERKDRHAQLASIQCPVLIVAGQEDRVFPVSDAARMASAIPGSRLVVLPEVGHLACAEAPAMVSKLVEEFVSKLGEAPALAT